MTALIALGLVMSVGVIAYLALSVLRVGEPTERIADDKFAPAPVNRQELETPA
jgi:hypothetical protein